MPIGETMTRLSCHQNNCPKVLKHDSIIIALGGISLKNCIPINHDKMTHLDKNCVTTNKLIDKFDEKTDMSDVIC